MIDSISAVTLATHDMARAVRFYRILGFEMLYGGDDAAFTSFRAGSGYLNLIAEPAERSWSWWGRIIFYHSDVDALHASVIAAGKASLPFSLPSAIALWTAFSIASCELTPTVLRNLRMLMFSASSFMSSSLIF